MQHTMRSALPDTPVTGRSTDTAGERLAEAAHYAVLKRIAPKLRHDLAGAMQPIGMIAMVLQRRLQSPQADLQAIAKNAASIAALTKEATASTMNAMSWLAPREEIAVGLQAGVEEVVGLLAMELSESGLVIANDLSEDGTEDLRVARAPQFFFRSVVAGALLAFCDEQGEAGKLHIRFEHAPDQGGDGRKLMFRRQPDHSVAALEKRAARPRRIVWADVKALATFAGAALAHGDEWVSLGLPKAA
jgi:hypothetical protein